MYLSWGHPQQTPEEVEKMFKTAMEEEARKIEEVKGLIVLQDVKNPDVPNFGRQNAKTDKSTWNRESSLKELLSEHWEELSLPEQEEVLIAMDDGLTEEQMVELFLTPLEEMDIRRRGYVLENGGKSGEMEENEEHAITKGKRS